MIKELFVKNGIEIDDAQAGKFAAYSSLLREYNEKVNLTAITDEREIAVKHFLDSALGLRFMPAEGEILDVGSGAGFPAIPLAILSQGKPLRFTLVDSLQKRVVFLNEAIARLGLDNATARHARAEEEAKNRRESYDLVTARAVAPLNVLSEYALPLVRIGGTFLAYKGIGAEEEAESAKKAISLLGGRTEGVVTVSLNGEYERKFVVVKKIAATPAKYPRGQNKPRILPL